MRPLPVIALALVVGCKGDAPDVPVEPSDLSEFTCDPSTAPSPTPMRRLSRDQYTQTVDVAMELLGGDALTTQFGPTVHGIIDRIPEDHADVTLSREDQAISLAHAEHWYLVAEAVADGAVAVGLPCGDAACVPGFVDDTGSRLLRRPLSEAERAFFVDEVYATAPDHAQGMRDLVLVWLASPMFALQIEHGVDGDPDVDTVALTAHELASRLSYHAWNTPPDDALWAAAEDGSLLDDAVYEAQVDRLFDDPRSQAPRERFFSDWLQLHEVPRLDLQVGQGRFDAFRGGITPGPDLHERILRDSLDLLEWHVRNESPLDAVWTAPLHTVLDPEVAALYGTETLWDGESTPAELNTGHGGLLTRPAFHVTGTADTRPIKKGVLVRRRILCDVLGDPPADLGEEPDIDPTATQRVRTEQLTEVEGSICVDCHARINPLGYATESFDGLGRFRVEETVYDPDGSVLATHPVDDQAAGRVDWTDESVLDGHGGLAEAIAASPKPDACVARFWFRHTWGRSEDDAVDGCVLQEMEQRLTRGESLDSAMRHTALADSFKTRRFDEGGDQ